MKNKEKSITTTTTEATPIYRLELMGGIPIRGSGPNVVPLRCPTVFLRH